ncbi:unnamed protein product [Dimorphilus gyrociliatus]|uniref:BHLH domain-containing protein n=1 Tax=Dimorphilus gyrociliatus TaxID=2664684 RepID=A0A7I8VFU7_9ANNE|nr:unnamed protein product [Dimorphilus gyrociliatus]
MEQMKNESYEVYNTQGHLYYTDAYSCAQEKNPSPPLWGQQPVPIEQPKPRIVMVNQSERYTRPRNSGKPKRKRIISYEQRKAANIRERRRMFSLNEAFDYLRQRLPTFSFERRLSRIETLRLAITYIGFMGDVVSGKSPNDVKLIPMPKFTGDKKKGRGGRRLKTHAHNG